MKYFCSQEFSFIYYRALYKWFRD